MENSTDCSGSVIKDSAVIQVFQYFSDRHSDFSWKALDLNVIILSFNVLVNNKWYSLKYTPLKMLEQLMENCHFNCLYYARNVVLKHRNWEKLTKLLLYTSKESDRKPGKIIMVWLYSMIDVFDNIWYI